MRFITLLIAAFGATLFPVSLNAFSTEGHELVGAIAQARLAQTPAGREALAKALALLQDPQDPAHTVASLAQAGPMPDALRAWDTLAVGRSPDALLGLYPTVAQVPAVAEMGRMVNVGADWPAALRQDMWEYFVANSQRDKVAPPQATHHVVHFCDVSIAPGTDLKYSTSKIGCNEHDIVHMIDYCVFVLKGATSDTPLIPKVTPRVAIVVLVHLLGDLHQPLHVGAEYFGADGKVIDPAKARPGDIVLGDAGGNLIQFGHGNLHSHWDSVVVQRAASLWARQLHTHASDLSALAQKIVETNPTTLTDVSARTKPLTLAKRWAEDGLKLSQQAHDRLEFDIKVHGTHSLAGTARPKSGTIEQYDEWAAVEIQQQIIRAGDRLAWMIEHSL